ncbi:MAG: 50S ribosomal protein L5 [Patescibacteria group bacterium]
MPSVNIEKAYKETMVKKMRETLNLPNVFMAPKIEKVVINIGVGKMRQQPQFDEKILPEITKSLSLISGQKPALTRAKKSIAGFKVREGDIVGLKTTLRGKRMYDFLDRLVNAALPRVRDFRGISQNSVDAKGNLTIGVKEHTVFPEIDTDVSHFAFGLEISVVVRARKREDAIELYKLMRIPLKI